MKSMSKVELIGV